MTYGDILSMPTYERRYFLSLLKTENTIKQEKIDDQQANASSGKGKRTTKVSGNALKAKLKSGEIPNQ